MRLLKSLSCAVVMGVFAISNAAFGAHSFTEDFSGNVLPSNLENQDNAFPATFSGGEVTLGTPAGDGFNDRRYVRTVETNYFGVDFVAEVTVTVPGPIDTLDAGGFFGIGQSNFGRFGEPDQVPTVYMRVTPNSASGPNGGVHGEFGTTQVVQDLLDDVYPGSVAAETFLTDAAGGLAAGSADPLGLVGSGTSRLQLSWNSTTEQATFSVDANYVGGAFAADFTSIPFDTNLQSAVPELGVMDDTNSNIFFGGGLGVVFDDFSVTVATAGLSADFNGDGDVDGADFLTWQRGFGLGGQVDNSNGDSNGDGTVDGLDLGEWEGQFGSASGPLSGIGAIPEPASALLALIATLSTAFVFRRR